MSPGAQAIENEKANGPRSRKGVRTRARLVEAAKHVFEDTGFLDARISDIAERAGLSHGSFYHYFDSKEQVFREVAERVYERISAPLTEVVLAPSSTATPAERLRQAIRDYLETYREEARIMGVIEQMSRYDDYVRDVLVARHRHSTEQIAGSIGQLQRRRMADRQLDPSVAAAALGAMTSRFAEMWLAQGLLECNLDDAAEQLTTLFINALGLRS